MKLLKKHVMDKITTGFKKHYWLANPTFEIQSNLGDWQYQDLKFEHKCWNEVVSGKRSIAEVMNPIKSFLGA